MEGLRGEGISDADIDTMIRHNPARLLGLDP
jgi:predicted metal-dependent phosphotriesterase family hydrolase